MEMERPVMAASWLTLMSSSPSEMCLRAASVPAVTTLLLLELLVLLVLESSEGEAGLGSGAGGGGDGEGAAGGMEGRKGEERGGSSSATDISLQEERQTA